MISNFPSELRYNLESIRDADLQAKQMTNNLRRDSLAYLRRMNVIANTTAGPLTVTRGAPTAAKFSSEFLDSLAHKLGSRERVNFLLGTPDNEARLSLLNYYREYKNALEKIEREVAQVRQMIETLNNGSSKLSAILSSLKKKSNNYTYGYKHPTTTPEAETRAQPLCSYTFKRRYNMKNRMSKHRKEAPCSNDEVLYCVCRQVSYGDMVGCDNENCDIEWFHYKCVGLTSSPKGAWHCDQCTKKLGLSMNSQVS